MTRTGSGLNGSIWASRRPYVSPTSDSRSQSVPPTASTITSAVSAPASTVQPTSNPTGSRLSPTQAFHRFEKACQRLRWKFLDLQNSYQRAMAPEEFGFTPEDADRNFKVDFHEFYSWIEQALVLLLLVFGISVSRSQQNGYTGGWGHAYHHNVLKALEEETCPVYSALGQGDVKQALWKAKELRNRWKDASEGKETPSLKMYDLTWIVTQILSGLEAGYGIATIRVQEDSADGKDVNIADAGEDEWEWMVETMDWEA